MAANAGDLQQHLEEMEEEPRDVALALLSLIGALGGVIGTTQASRMLEEVNWLYDADLFDQARAALVPQFLTEPMASRVESRIRGGFDQLKLTAAAHALLHRAEALPWEDFGIAHGVALLEGMREFLVEEEPRMGSSIAATIFQSEEAVGCRQTAALANGILAGIEVTHVLADNVLLAAYLGLAYEHGGMTAHSLRIFRHHFTLRTVEREELHTIHLLLEIPRNVILAHTMAERWPHVWPVLRRRLLAVNELERDGILRSLCRMAVNFRALPLAEVEEVIVAVHRQTGGVTSLTVHNLLHSYIKLHMDDDAIAFRERIPALFAGAIVDMGTIDGTMCTLLMRREGFEAAFAAAMAAAMPLEGVHFGVSRLIVNHTTPRERERVFQWCEENEVFISASTACFLLEQPNAELALYNRCLALVDEHCETILAMAIRRRLANPAELTAAFRQQYCTVPSAAVMAALASNARTAADAETVIDDYVREHAAKPNCAAMLAVLRAPNTVDDERATIHRFHAEYGLRPDNDVLCALIRRHGRDAAEPAMELANEFHILPSQELAEAIVWAHQQQPNLAANWIMDRRLIEYRSERLLARLWRTARNRDRNERQWVAQTFVVGLVQPLLHQEFPFTTCVFLCRHVNALRYVGYNRIQRARGELQRLMDQHPHLHWGGGDYARLRNVLGI
mmetsp:Transcript_19520/g.74907  ORF Transcript_19520/g.74907 Transcript_19520/m.74907 type:complete len:679 (-) Transcript_19520:12-2048(-)